MTVFYLSTVGTTGDIEPYVHLARGLSARGHQVRVSSHGMHARRFSEHQFVPAAKDLQIGELNSILDEAALVQQPLLQFGLLVRRIFLDDAEGQFERHKRAMEGVQVAVIHRFDYVAQEAAIHLGIPWASVSIMPDVYRSDERPPYPIPRLARWLTRRAWDGLEQSTEQMNAVVARALAKLGAPPRQLGIAGASSEQLDLLAASPSLVPVPSDWPERLVVTGTWCAPPSSPEPEGELAEFYSRHPRPLVVSLGSMGGSDKNATNALFSEALGQVGHPVIIQSGYQGIGGNKTEALLTVGFVPHDLLFTRAACIIHHAGAGTAASVARAGVPSVPIPHMFDQYYWAGMLHQRGVATSPAPRASLTAKLLAKRIREALGSKAMAERAQAIGARMKVEDGVGRAIQALERLSSRSEPDSHP